MKAFYVGPKNYAGIKHMQIVEVGATYLCNNCQTRLTELLEFPFTPFELLQQSVCYCRADIVMGAFNYTNSKNLIFIDDQETRDAFERLEELDKKKEKQKGRVKAG